MSVTRFPFSVSRGNFMRALLCAFLLATGNGHLATAQPITSDSRIKTFVYNPNEVFTITTHYGYQSNIEFGPKETIDTISVGDRVGWQIIPAGRRLFIRAMEENAHTNMTIVTNMRAYIQKLRKHGFQTIHIRLNRGVVEAGTALVLARGIADFGGAAAEQDDGLVAAFLPPAQQHDLQ